MIGIKVYNEQYIIDHTNAIMRFFDIKKRTVHKKDLIDKRIEEITDGKYNLESIIKAEPNKFKYIIDLVERVGKFDVNDFKNKKRGYIDPLDSMLYIYKKFSKAGDEDFTEIQYGALDLIKNLNIKVCPYCNRNFINNTVLYDKDDKAYEKRVAQLDHFYPESKYPYLALSFYNLIPSCPSCNTIKLVQYIGINPYLIKDSDEHLIFDYEFNSSINKKIINAKYKSKEFEENWKAFGLEALYEQESDYLNDLIYRIQIYNKVYKENIQNYINKFNNLEPENSIKITEDNFERIILGNYIEEEDLSKQPLSKLTKDIYSKYK